MRDFAHLLWTEMMPNDEELDVSKYFIGLRAYRPWLSFSLPKALQTTACSGTDEGTSKAIRSTSIPNFFPSTIPLRNLTKVEAFHRSSFATLASYAVRFYWSSDENMAFMTRAQRKWSLLRH